VRRSALATIGVALLLGACRGEAPPPVEIKTSAPPLSYLGDVKPVLDRRCVACHSCYNAPCQLKLSSYEGLDRGANKQGVYSSSRLHAQDPTRLFMDAQTTEQWRAKGFTSVLENTAGGDLNDSILLELLEAKRRQPVPVGRYEPEAGGQRFAREMRAHEEPREEDHQLLDGVLLDPEDALEGGVTGSRRRGDAVLAARLARLNDEDEVFDQGQYRDDGD